jgi:hypothetical protein
MAAKASFSQQHETTTATVVPHVAWWTWLAAQAVCASAWLATLGCV